MKKNIASLIFLFEGFKGSILLPIIFVITWTILESTLLYSIKLIIDNQFKFSNQILYLITVFAFTYLIIEACIKITNYIVLKFVSNFLESLQTKLAKILINQDSLFFQNINVEGTSSKIINLSNIVENLYKTFLYGLTAGLSGFITTIFLISIASSWLASCFVAWLSSMILIGILCAKRINELAVEYAKSNNILIGELNDILSNHITIEAFNRQEYELSRYKDTVIKHKNLKQNLETYLFKIDLFRSFVSVLFFILAVYVSSIGILDGQTSLGDLIFVISASFICKKDIWHISIQIVEIHKNWGFVQDVLELFKKTKTNFISEKNEQTLLKSTELKDISYNDLITNASLLVQEGEKIAIIGPSGSGKTTLARLIAGLYTPTSGKIIHNNSHKSVGRIVYIDQNISLFDRSIGENIFYDHDNVDDVPRDKLKEILNSSLCSNFVKASNHNLRTKVKNLSLGQKHLVAIARAINESPEWLILDEPCVYLDPVTEEKLIQNLGIFAENKTLIVITHSPKILKLMSRIIVIESGKLVADSKVDNLQANEFYRKFLEHE